MRRPTQLPNPGGVGFFGTDYSELPSRTDVGRLVDGFIERAQVTKGTTIAAVLGEWGEGKTELYNGRIKPRATRVGSSLVVPASTLSNCYDRPSVAEILKEEGAEATRFLVVLFEAIRLTDSNKGIGLPDISRFKDTRSYVMASLGVLSEVSPAGRDFIFIDEFEELVNQQTKLRMVVSGLKELVNGEFAELNEGGKFEGRLHIILACTPAAYYRISSDRDVGPVFGGFGRRVLVIGLTQPRKGEVLDLVESILKKSWDDNLPTPHPFRNSGIHETLRYVTRGNLGNLVQLLSKILSIPTLESISTIDGSTVLEVLRTHRFMIYGAETSGLESDLFAQMTSTLSESAREQRGHQLVALFRTVCGEHIPHSVDDFKAAFAGLFDTSHSVKSGIDEINQTLSRRFKVDRSIVQLRAVTGTDAPSVIETLISEVGATKKGDRVEGDIIILDDFREKIDSLEDRLTHYWMNPSVTKSSRVFVPADEASAAEFFRGVTQDTAREIVYALAPRGSDAPSHYMISESLRTQVFPSPVPQGLEFVLDQTKRLEIWRQTGRELDALVEEYVPRALPELLSRLREWSVTSLSPGKNRIFDSEVVHDETAIRVSFTPLLQDPKKSDLRDAIDLVRRPDHPAHLCIVPFTGEMSQDAETSLEASSLGPKGVSKVIPLPVSVGVLRRLVAISYALKVSPESAVDEGALQFAVDRILREDTQLIPKIENSLATQTKAGYVFAPLRSTTGNLNLQAKSLRFFLNFSPGPFTLEELWERTHRELLDLQFFGGKKSLVPDIEFPQFQTLSEDLIQNGFLSRDGDKIFLRKHPVEERVLQFLGTGELRSVAQVTDYFVDPTGTNLLANVFLETLEDRGLVAIHAKQIRLADLDSLASTLAAKLDALISTVRRSQQAFDDYGLLFVSKKRDLHWIDYSDWISLLRSVSEGMLSKENTPADVRGPRLRLLAELVDQFDRRVVEPVVTANREATLRMRELKKARAEFHALVTSEMAAVTRIWSRPGVLHLVDEEELSAGCDQLEALHARAVKEIGGEERDKLIEAIGRDHFTFIEDEDLSPADYFNPKYSWIKRSVAEFKERMLQISRTLGEVEARLHDTREREQRVSTLVKSFNIPQEAPISAELKRALLAACPGDQVPSPGGQSTAVRLPDVVRIVDERIHEREATVDRLWDIARDLRPLFLQESSFARDFTEFQRTLSAFSRKFGGSLDQIVLANSANMERRIHKHVDEITRRVKAPTQTLDPAGLQEFVNETKAFLERETSQLSTLKSLAAESVNGIVQRAASQIAVLRSLADYVADMGDREWVSVRARSLEEMMKELEQSGSSPPYSEFGSRLAETAEGTYDRVARSLGNDVLHARALEVALRETLHREYVEFFDLRRRILEECHSNPKDVNAALDYLFERKLLEPFVRRKIR